MTKRLDEVVAGRDVAEIVDGIPDIRLVDDCRAAGRELLDVAAEERDAVGLIELQAGLARAVARDHHVDAAGDWRAVDGGGYADLEADRLPRPVALGENRRDEQCDESGDQETAAHGGLPPISYAGGR